MKIRLLALSLVMMIVSAYNTITTYNSSGVLQSTITGGMSSPYGVAVH